MAVTGIMLVALDHAGSGGKGAWAGIADLHRASLVAWFQCSVAEVDATMLLIVWHSRTGASEALAQAAHDGARTQGPCRLLRAGEAVADDLLAASGYLFCCPENLGTMSGAMKEFFDLSYYPLLGRIEGRAYATIIAAGSDGTGAQRQIDRIATGWRLKRVADPIIIGTAAQTPEAIMAPKHVGAEALRECHDLGQGLCGGLALGVF